MKKITLLFLILLTLFCLASCAGGDGVPEGLKIANGSEELGYYFYVPEEWVVSNYADISAAYASKVDASSMSYVETEAPTVSDDDTISQSARRAVATKDYFMASIADFPNIDRFLYEGEAVTFGNAEDAFKFVFEFEREEHKIRTMQILVYFEDRFGIFTFTSPNENKSSSDKSQFDFYIEKVQRVIDNFKFTMLFSSLKKS